MIVGRDENPSVSGADEAAADGKLGSSFRKGLFSFKGMEQNQTGRKEFWCPLRPRNFSLCFLQESQVSLYGYWALK